MIYPQHIAIIPDGNRTWARENNKSVAQAYMISYQRGVDLLRYTFTHTDIKVMTLRGLSTENSLKRPREEYDFLMNMYKLVDEELDDFLIQNQINFIPIGDLEGITPDFREYLIEKQNKTRCGSDKYFVFGINYGGRDEIIRGIKNLNQTGFDFNNITEQALSESMDLAHIPPVELVIRTKGDEAQRISGFMLRWIGYSELFFSHKKCPELDEQEYKKAIEYFDNIATKRNYGK